MHSSNQTSKMTQRKQYDSEMHRDASRAPDAKKASRERDSARRQKRDWE